MAHRTRRSAARTLWDRSIEDRYGDPGTALRRARASGTETIVQTGDTIFLAGTGASPQGDKPFLDTLSLTTLTTARKYQMTEGYEPVLGLASDDGSRVITRFETRVDAAVSAGALHRRRPSRDR